MSRVNRAQLDGVVPLSESEGVALLTLVALGEVEVGALQERVVKYDAP